MTLIKRKRDLKLFFGLPFYLYKDSTHRQTTVTMRRGLMILHVDHSIILLKFILIMIANNSWLHTITMITIKFVATSYLPTRTM